MFGLTNPEWEADGFNFAAGYCIEFAVALHDTFGWPLEMLLEHEFDTGVPNGIAHAYCLRSPCLLVDVGGLIDHDHLYRVLEPVSMKAVFSRRHVTTMELVEWCEKWRDFSAPAYYAARRYILEHRDRLRDPGSRTLLID